MRHQSFLEYKRYRYLKVAVWLCIAAIGAYGWHRAYHFDAPGGLGYGGSWMGYTLGTVAALMIVWLLWLGIRKRRYGASVTTVQGWLSAHVYLGGALVIVATLHTGFELGYNLHSLAFALMLVVVVSGIYGVLVLVGEPASMTSNMGGDSVASLLLQLQEIDTLAHKLALQLPDAFNTLVTDAANKTRLQGSVLAHMFRTTSRSCPTAHAVARMQLLNRQLKDEQARFGREVVSLMLRRRATVKKLRREFRSLARLRMWLLLHVPVSLALLCALVGHIVSVFIYW